MDTDAQPPHSERSDGGPTPPAAGPEVDPQRLEDLFERATALDEDDRRSLLQRVEGDTPLLAQELAGLLGAVARRPDLLAQPATLEVLASLEDELSEEAPAPEPSPDHAPSVPGFRLKHALGTGATGTVWEAEQERPRRIVALKLLAHEHAGPGLQQRFLHEAEALARLDHPHVARVFGAGLVREGGRERPWIAVEHIADPKPLTDYAADEGLDPVARVRLFLPLCDAIQHAHERGVLHRDLKPANLLVPGDGQGGARVIDFGLARLQDPVDADELARTRSGELLGTLRYMSPEQAQGDPGAVGVRSDVYGLGVVLFELLAGTLPYALEGRTLLQVLRTVRETPARLASAVAPAGVQLDGELDAVLARALAKDPAARYGSAAELSADLARWLRSEPVTARPPRWTRSLWMFARRRKGRFAALALATAGTLAATVTIAVLLVRTQSALSLYREADALALERAEEIDAARGELGRLRADLVDLDRSVQESSRRNAALVVESARAKRAAAETASGERLAVFEAIESLRRLAPTLEEDAESLPDLAAAFDDLGRLQGARWDASATDARSGVLAYGEAARLRRRILAASPANEAARLQLGWTLVELSQSHRKVSDDGAALVAADEAIAVARPLTEGEDATWRGLQLMVEALWARSDAHIRMPPFEQGLLDSLAARTLCERIEADPEAPLAAQVECRSWTELRVGIWLEREEDDLVGSELAHRRAVDARVAHLRDALARGLEREVLEERARLCMDFFLWNELERLSDPNRPTEELGSAAERLGQLQALGIEVVVDLALPRFAPTTAVLTARLVDAVADSDALVEASLDAFWSALDTLAPEPADAAVAASVELLESIEDELGTEGLQLLEMLRPR